MAELLSEFTTYLASPGNYSNPTKEYRARCLAGLKTMFDFYKRRAEGELEEMEKKPGCRPISTGPLSELYTEGLDMDQIWEQVELVNKPVIKGLSGVVHGLEAKMERGEFQLVNIPSEGGKNPVVSDDDDDGISSEHEEGDDDDDEIGSDFRASDEDEPSGKVGGDGGGGKRSVVDDRFFKLLEMEKFLELAERDEEKEGMYLCTCNHCMCVYNEPSIIRKPLYSGHLFQSHTNTLVYCLTTVIRKPLYSGHLFRSHTNTL